MNTLTCSLNLFLKEQKVILETFCNWYCIFHFIFHKLFCFGDRVCHFQDLMYCHWKNIIERLLPRIRPSFFSPFYNPAPITTLQLLHKWRRGRITHVCSFALLLPYFHLENLFLFHECMKLHQNLQSIMTNNLDIII